MSSEPLRHAHSDSSSAREDAGFVVWGCTGWIAGILPWLGFVYFAYPLAWAAYHGRLASLPPMLWAPTGVLFLFVFVALPAFALYAGRIVFVVVRVFGDGITVGQWFGARRIVYRSSEIASWCLVDRRWRDVGETKSAKRLRIDFLDGSWVALSRYTWNFRRLEAWLRLAASGAGPTQSTGAPRSPHRFVVRDVLTLPLVLVVWVLYWTMVAYNLASPSWQRPVDIASAIVWVVMAGLVPLVLGSLCAHVVLDELRVDAPHIHVRRWFGLVRRTYREDDIKSWRASHDSNPPWWRQGAADGSYLLLRFADGAPVYVTGGAANFRALLRYLRDGVPTREDIRRSNKRKDASR
jgi:hypothetical protein